MASIVYNELFTVSGIKFIDILLINTCTIMLHVLEIACTLINMQFHGPTAVQWILMKPQYSFFNRKTNKFIFRKQCKNV